jgi:N-methylhydantoinase A
LNVPFNSSLKKALKAFTAAHKKRYGHSTPEEPVEMVTARVRVIGAVKKPMLKTERRRKGKAASGPPRKRGKMKIHERSNLFPGDRLSGPALVVEDFATTFLPVGWHGSLDRYGNMFLER